MKSTGPWWGIAVLVLGILIVLRFIGLQADSPNQASRDPLKKNTTTRSSAHSSEQRTLVSLSAGKMVESDWSDLFDWLDSDPAPSEEEIRDRLLALRSKWAEMDPTLLAETLARLLETGRDRSTGMKFRVGLHGFLEGWPTLRVFLLDALVVADAETAAGIARDILDRTDHPDEYAVALRSLTRDGALNANEGELIDHLTRALDTPEWQESGGFAESLDLARTIGTGSAAGELLRWDGNPALKSMALHEFAADHPEEMLDALRSEDTVNPMTRANLMARLDPAAPDQLEAIDEYLRDPGLPPESASIFLRSFPLRSATTGNRLYSPSPAPYEMERILAGDRAALSRVESWVTDPALEPIRPELQALQLRLAEWIDQANE